MTGWWAVSYIALWVLVVVLAVVVLALARQVGTLHLRLGPRGALEVDDEGPELGEAPGPIAAHDLDGRPTEVGGPGRSRMLLFVSPDCPVCREVLPSLPVVARQGHLAPSVVVDGAVEEALAAPHLLGTGAPVVLGERVAEAMDVPGTPYVVVLDELGVVRAKGTVNNLEQMEGLVDTAARRLADAPEERSV
ncbi:MAG TPA: alkyl hydroperoxide reductase [Actinomycetota bacterium]|nr:alkyl hydroperoxide reductase [Actinomycetota bacterium]